MYKDLTDEELMLKICDKDKKAFDEIYTRYNSMIYNYLFKLIADKNLVDDIFQETFTKLYFKANRYNPKYKLRSWLYKISTNCYFDYLKSRKKKAITVDSQRLSYYSSELDGPLDSIVKKEELDTLKRAIYTLPENIKQVFVLKFYQGLKYDEIAEIIGVSNRTAKNYMRHAKEHIKNYVGEFEY